MSEKETEKEMQELQELLKEMEREKRGGGPGLEIDYSTADLETIKHQIVEGLSSLNWGLDKLKTIKQACANRTDVQEMLEYFEGMFPGE